MAMTPLVRAMFVGALALQAAASAHGTETLVEKKTRQLGNPLMMKNPGAMLTELEEMARSGEAPAFDVVTAIKGLIENNETGIMKDLQTTRSASAQDTTDHLDAIQSCNDASTTKEGDIEAGTQASVSNLRSVHTACRGAERNLYDTNLTGLTEPCVMLGIFLHDAKPLSIPDASPRDAAVQYVKTASDSNMCGRSEVTDLDDRCTAKEGELTAKKAECLAKQHSFEEGFCTWKTELELNCNALDTCHSTAVTAYSNHVSKTQTLVTKWDTETAALQKILCYCDVWLNELHTGDAGDDRSHVNATKFEACNGQSHTPVSVDYGTPAEKVACLLTSVANHPGTPGFITQEYDNFISPAWPVPTVVACMAETTTEAACSWTRQEGINSGAYAGGNSTAFSDQDAKSKCIKLGADVCKAITCRHPNMPEGVPVPAKTCTVRASTSSGTSTSGETTYVPATTCFPATGLLVEHSAANIADGKGKASAEGGNGSMDKDQTRKRIVRRASKTEKANSIQVDSQGNVLGGNVEASPGLLEIDGYQNEVSVEDKDDKGSMLSQHQDSDVVAATRLA